MEINALKMTDLENWTFNVESRVFCLMASPVQVLYIVLIEDTAGFPLFVSLEKIFPIPV